MNELEENNFKLMCSKYKNICISIDLFCDFLKQTPFTKLLDPILDRGILQTGLYANIIGTDIWVSKLNASTDGKHYIRVSNAQREDIDSRSTDGWSPLLELEDLDRLLNLKAFW